MKENYRDDRNGAEAVNIRTVLKAPLRAGA